MIQIVNFCIFLAVYLHDSYPYFIFSSLHIFSTQLYFRYIIFVETIYAFGKTIFSAFQMMIVFFILDLTAFLQNLKRLCFGYFLSSDTCNVRNQISFLQIGDVRKHLATSLGNLSGRVPGKVGPLITQLNPNAQQVLNQYLQSAGVTIQQTVHYFCPEIEIQKFALQRSVFFWLGSSEFL